MIDFLAKFLSRFIAKDNLEAYLEQIDSRKRFIEVAVHGFMGLGVFASLTAAILMMIGLLEPADDLPRSVVILLFMVIAALFGIGLKACLVALEWIVKGQIALLQRIRDSEEP